MQKYSVVFVGLIMAVLGWLNWSHVVTEGEVAVVIDNITQIVGYVVIWIGRVRQGDITPLGFKK